MSTGSGRGPEKSYLNKKYIFWIMDQILIETKNKLL